MFWGVETRVLGSQNPTLGGRNPDLYETKSGVAFSTKKTETFGFFCHSGTPESTISTKFGRLFGVFVDSGGSLSVRDHSGVSEISTFSHNSLIFRVFLESSD